MTRKQFLVLILAIAIATKLVMIKIDRDMYRLENTVYEDIADIYTAIANQTDLINKIK